MHTDETHKTYQMNRHQIHTQTKSTWIKTHHTQTQTLINSINTTQIKNQLKTIKNKSKLINIIL